MGSVWSEDLKSPSSGLTNIEWARLLVHQDDSFRDYVTTVLHILQQDPFVYHEKDDTEQCCRLVVHTLVVVVTNYGKANERKWLALFEKHHEGYPAYLYNFDKNPIEINKSRDKCVMGQCISCASLQWNGTLEKINSGKQVMCSMLTNTDLSFRVTLDDLALCLKDCVYG